jgi:hypothetical protein
MKYIQNKSSFLIIILIFILIEEKQNIIAHVLFFMKLIQKKTNYF